jgi:hypothetical protein
MLDFAEKWRSSLLVSANVMQPQSETHENAVRHFLHIGNAKIRCVQKDEPVGSFSFSFSGLISNCVDQG